MSARIFTAVLICASLAACGREDTPGPGARDAVHRAQPVALRMVDGRPDPAVLAAEQVLHRDNGNEPQTLDPHLAQGVPAANILRDLFEGLTAESPTGAIIPGAAERWNISRDGLLYTFHLRANGRWSNGDPVTATDFVEGFRRSADPATASQYAHVLRPITGAAGVLAGTAPVDSLGVTALDERTVQVSLVDPTPYFLGLLSHASTYPVHRPSVAAHGERYPRPGNLVSNGAFVLSEWKVRSRIELTRNPHYHGVADVIPERVVYYPYEDSSTALKQYRSGRLHWTWEVPANQFDWLQANYPDELAISPWLGSYFLGYNLSREPFAHSLELRLALVLAVDREILTGKVTRFGEQPTFNLVPPGIGDYEPPEPEWTGWTQAQREEEARRLFAIAGYGDDRPLRVQLRYNTSENHKKVALAVASMWKQVLGVQTELINEEWKVFLQNRQQKVLTQVFRAGWIGDYADPYTFLELFRSGHGQNDFAFSDTLYDTLLEQASSERIPARRNRLMVEAERVLLEDQPIIPLYTYVTRRLVDPHLRGWAPNVMDHHYSRHMFLLKSEPRP
ncbi:peptide ABC transporter substrate-binding protein [Marinihelvus fidelis]|nr:peptide ABC transporter substrate-binding protein [Marinihelvus fidelis]